MTGNFENEKLNFEDVELYFINRKSSPPAYTDGRHVYLNIARNDFDYKSAIFHELLHIWIYTKGISDPQTHEELIQIIIDAINSTSGAFERLKLKLKLYDKEI